MYNGLDKGYPQGKIMPSLCMWILVQNRMHREWFTWIYRDIWRNLCLFIYYVAFACWSDFIESFKRLNASPKGDIIGQSCEHNNTILYNLFNFTPLTTTLYKEFKTKYFTCLCCQFSNYLNSPVFDLCCTWSLQYSAQKHSSSSL